jgi:hypothetical protein
MRIFRSLTTVSGPDIPTNAGFSVARIATRALYGDVVTFPKYLRNLSATASA